MLSGKSSIVLFASLVFSAALLAQALPPNRIDPARLRAVLAGQQIQACAGLASLRSVATDQALLELYERNNFATLWEAPERLAMLQRELARLADDGLNSADYTDALNAQPATQPCDELLISSEYLLALQHLSAGRFAQERFAPRWSDADASGARAMSPAGLAAEAGENIALAFEKARPALALYQDLRLAYGRMDKQPPLLPPVPAGASIKPGSTDARIPQLTQRLQAEGYLAADRRTPSQATEWRYEPDIEQAVLRFQADHSLQVDGIVGTQTLAALNVPLPQRVQQVRINLERLRWFNTMRSDHLLLVNIAGGAIRLYRNGEIAWQSKVMSGRPERPTPALVSQIDRITLNPAWTVPPTIFKEDKLPQIRRNLVFLAQNNLLVLDEQGKIIDPRNVDWNKPSGIVLRQPPGPTNPLGRFAFRFPSPFAVYLHDTPSQELFEKSARNISSGCVRVQDAEGLAYQLLSDKSPTELAQIELLRASGETHEIRLPNGPRLIIAYWTAETDESGHIRYLRDPYDMDHTLIDAFERLDAAHSQGVDLAMETSEMPELPCRG